MFMMQLFWGCSKGDEPTSTSKKVVFKAEASAGSTVRMIVYGYDASLTTISNANTQTWTSSEIVVPATANVASISGNGMGANAAATLKVQIYVNGQLKKEGTSTGTALSVTSQHNL